MSFRHLFFLLFSILCLVIRMIIYVDLLFFLNLFFDFHLLLTVNNALKRYIKLKRILFASFIGALTTFILFLSFDTFWLFLLKIVLGMLLCLIAFGIKDRKYFFENFLYLLMSSMVLGGFLYFFLLTLSENHSGLAFSYHEIKLSFLFFVFLSPFLLTQYVLEQRKMKQKQQVVPVTICFRENQYVELVGFIDTGNHLEDVITKKKIILVSEKEIPKTWDYNPYYVPYHSLNHHGLLSCIKISYLEILGKRFTNYLVGISHDLLLEDGIECVLHETCLEEMI